MMRPGVILLQVGSRQNLILMKYKMTKPASSPDVSSFFHSIVKNLTELFLLILIATFTNSARVVLLTRILST